MSRAIVIWAMVLGGTMWCGAESNTVWVVSGTTSNKPEGVVVGNTGTNNTLTVSGAGVLTTTNWAILGFWDEADHNTATITDPGSLWIIGGGLFVGGFGSGNRLSILSGGMVRCSNQTALAMGPGAASNAVLISGAGSALLATNRLITIGEEGYGNSITISNHGTLRARYLTLGKGLAANGNQLRVGGSGRVVCQFDLTCGSSGSWNRVELNPGGDVETQSASLGWEATAHDNEAMLNMATWSNRNRMYVGRWGSHNRLVLTNGAFLYIADEFAIGEQSNSVGNEVIVSMSTLIASNMFYVGYRGASNRLEIQNGGRVVGQWNIYVGDAPISERAAHGNTVWVRGTNSILGVQSDFYLGRESGWNQLELSGGARMINSNAYLGWGESLYPSNGIRVVDAGTFWTNSGEIYISGPGNYVIVSNQARVQARQSRITDGAPGQVARLVVDGSGSEWRVQETFYVSYIGAIGEAVATNGGHIYSGYGYIGVNNYDSNGTVLITGVGSVWSNAGNIKLGAQGHNNQLLIRQGGKVWNNTFTLSDHDLASDNLAHIEGAGSELICQGALWMGYSYRNYLLINQGGRFFCTNAELSLAGTSSGNVIRVADAGSVWSNTGPLRIGSWTRASWSRVDVHTGAQLFCQSVFIGDWRLSSNHWVQVNGANARLFTDHLAVGQTGLYNRLLIESGGQVRSQTGVIGSAPAATGNEAIVTGPGTLWSNSSALIIGDASPLNSLWVENSARVWAGSLGMGIATNAVGNTLGLQTGALLQVSTTTDIHRGTMVLSGGAFQSPRLNLWTNAVFSGAGTVTASSVYNHGTIQIGEPVGHLLVGGALYQQPGSTLRFDLAGYGAGVGYDHLTVTNGFGKGGTLEVARTTGFLPKNNDEFLLVSWPGGFTSTGFAATNLPAWFDWQVSHSPAQTGLVLRVLAVQTATNGVPKAWLADHGWTNHFDAAATNDPDGDHAATWEEYFAGTDPTNSTSVFRCLNLAHSAGSFTGMVMQWSTVTGHVYAVEAATNSLGTATWLELATNLPAMPGVWTAQVLNADNTQYRIRAQAE